ncbi:MFS transporter [Streptomyces sp. NBC_01190]|uniref:MFS transporter n=1 Tax=Streptomyces sp. NBC_01190 TaxID=2903767 RepID=UPI00386D3791|nr:MHS family MFS transporter [Streptomyces sp. NBC_01190]
MSVGQRRRAVLSSLIGNSIEFYEFLVYGSFSSLYFGKLFFPSFDPTTGTLLSLSTFAVAFVGRPLGAFFFGHFGDRIGRKKTLVTTLVVMGGATVLIGLLPTYRTIGVAAPILLTTLRFIQGCSLGGESSGGFLMALESAQPNRRGFLTGIVGTGNAWGLLLANGVLLLVTLLPDQQVLSWAWRLPFLFSAVLVGVALHVRLRLTETPEFAQSKAEGAVRTRPALDVVSRHGLITLSASLSLLPTFLVFYLGSVFSLKYGASIGVSRSVMLTLLVTACVFLIFAMPFFGRLGDRYNRKAVFVGGIAVMTLAPFAWFPLFDTRSFPLMALGFLLLFAGFAANYGAQGTYLPELFPTVLRYSGMSISYNVGGLLGGAVSPIIATALLSRYHTWTPIAIYMAAAGVIGLVASRFLREYAESAVPQRVVELVDLPIRATPAEITTARG